MKFYSYSNNNGNYTQAVSLNEVRSVHLIDGDGKSAIRFTVRIDYVDGKMKSFAWLTQEEAKKVYTEIVNLLNK